MHNTRLRPISKKQAAKNKHWKEVTDDRAKRLNYRCEWCGQWGSRTDERFLLDGHHIIKRRYNIHTEENCFVCHRFPCHRKIEDENIKVYRGMKGIWAEGDNMESGIVD